MEGVQYSINTFTAMDK